MLRMAVVYSLGMLIAAAATGALLGLLSSLIPEAWHHYAQVGIGGILLLTGLAFMARPLSVHHAIDHICSEACHSGEEKALLRTGTSGALFMLGVMSMIIPCPTNIWVYYTLPAVASSALVGSLIFMVYALFTGVAVVFVAIAMVRARTLVEVLERRGYRLLILRLSGLIVLGVGVWLLWVGLGTHHEPEPGTTPPGVHGTHHAH